MPSIKMLAVLFAVVPTLGYAGDHFSGKYYCNGYDPSTSSNYDARLEITETEDRIYQWRWISHDGDQNAVTLEGTGFVRDGVFAAAFKQGAGYVIQLYTIKDHGDSLSGEWMVGASGMIGREECNR